MYKKLCFLLIITLHTLIFSQNIPDSIYQSCANAISIDSIYMHMQNLQDFVSRYAFYPNQREVVDYIKNYFNALQIPSVELDSFMLVGLGQDTTWQYNVVASIPGTQHPDRIVILGAHHDAMSGEKYNVPGADDNASGVAVMLEVARVFRENKYTPRNTIRFISFAAEEVQRLCMGSRVYAGRAVASNMDIRLMVNMDMLAWTGDTATWKMAVHQYPGQEWLMPMVQRAVARVSPIPVFHVGAGMTSDSYVFYVRGYNAVWITENFGSSTGPVETHPYYHTKNDRVENYDLSYCTELARGVSALMLYADDTLSTVDIIQQTVSTENNRPFQCRYNPSTRMITISLGDRPGYPNTISLYSAQGRKLYTVNTRMNGKYFSFYPGQLASQGILIIAVSFSDRTYREKITLLK